MKLKGIALMSAVLAIAGWIAVTPTMATKEIAAKEKKSCVTCHTKLGAKELNELGKYYQEKKTLEGFKPKK